MRLSVRLIFPLLGIVTLVSLVFSYYQVRREIRIQARDLSRRAELMAESLDATVQPMLASKPSLQRVVERFGAREHLVGAAVYDSQGAPLAVSAKLPPGFAAAPAVLAKSLREKRGIGEFVRMGNAPMHVYAAPLVRDDEVVGGLVLVQEASYIQHQGMHLWRYLLFSTSVQLALIVITTLLIVRQNVMRPLAKTAQWMRALRTGHSVSAPADLFAPLAREVTTLAESLVAARASAEKEAQLREAGDAAWTANRLAVSLKSKLGGSSLFVVANREPYMHTRRGNQIETIIPASGLVTALEPVLSACDGTWVAHGSGDADREMVDARDHLRVPPDDPRYTLRRVWLTKAEEEGYYFGFSNEGLWPLCHIAHTRPLFRSRDWEAYCRVNRKFADAVLEEMKETERPVVIVQDYHYALLPRLIKLERPDARVAIFWHIPWPNPEAFSICPWGAELLDGLLGADLVGFHIQFHCNNFLETVDRTLESRVDWEHFVVNRREHVTRIRPFPISIVWPEEPSQAASPVHLRQSALLAEFGLEALFMGVGVDRVDYTKGIIERFLAIERLLEKYPSYQGKFTFAQIGAPSRTHIKRYHDLLAEVEAEAERINWRFQSGKWKPILMLQRHHSHEQIGRFYRAADLCLVTSLHDGMNLVAKEFVASRSDADGVLILSRFAGASRELRDALVINPYDSDEVADAIRTALEMNAGERRQRMQRLRREVREHNVYRWASNLITELCEMPVETAEGLSSRRLASAANS